MVNRDELIEYMENDAYRPLSVQDLVNELHIDGADEFKEFVRLLNQLEENGEVVRTRTNRYGIPDRMNLVVGRLQMKARGFGFLIPDTAGEPDMYIPATELNGAMSGDKVMARIEKAVTGPRREGKIIRVLERANNRLVGKFTKHREHAFVSPTDKRFSQDIFIGQEDMLDAHDGYIVIVEITEFPTPTRGPEGRVVEVLGHPDAPGIDILTVIKKYGLPEEFPEMVLRTAENIPVDLSAEDYEGRRDLRDEVIVTIDGEDAKDLDDAVHVKRLENGNYLLGVHIADVGYYVKEGGNLDNEALKRGTSVYLVDRVIPMLPQRLSNNICSLNPKVDRLTMSCQMEIDEDGHVVHHEIFPSVIKTRERMTYTNVRKILEDNDQEIIARYQELVPHFELMEDLAMILNQRRKSRGAIDFDFEEVKVVVDDLGHPTDIVPRVRSIAERIIEEFMLAANETVAEHFHWMNAPFVYRIHEEPELDRMMEFNEFVHNFGYHVKGLGGKIHPRALQSVLENAKGSREERVISTLMLRSMKQARYSPDCVGHFGLAAQYYSHFTSPIRRYPDLMIHRIMREAITGNGITSEREDRLRELVAQASVQSSTRERIAQDAEREVDQLKMVEYMLDHIGEEYDGLISGVTQFGLFVQLTNGVEGLIHISFIADDYYVFNDRHMALVGERTRRVFRLGDPIRVKVAGASKENLTIDFELVAHLREGTMHFDGSRGTVVYDEDLSPGERKQQIADRKHNAKYKGAGHWVSDGSRNPTNRTGTAGGRDRNKHPGDKRTGRYGTGAAQSDPYGHGSSRRGSNKKRGLTITNADGSVTHIDDYRPGGRRTGGKRDSSRSSDAPFSSQGKNRGFAKGGSKAGRKARSKPR